MACDITRGRLIDCKDTIGGLKAIYIAKSYSNNVSAAATINTTEMTTAGFATWSCCGGTVTVFKYDLVQNLSSLSVTINSDNANGTTFFTQALSVVLQKIDHDMTNELRLMAYSRSQIFVQDANDNVYLLGIDGGCYVTGGTVVTGAAMGDLSGYTLTLTGMETKPAVFMAHTDGQEVFNSTDFAGLTGTITITEGTNS